MLEPFGWLYGKIINRRNDLFQKGTFKTHSLGVPTISVGNITVGGTGKTPLVGFITEILAEKGEKICIISRGYKRENEKERVLVSDGRNILTDVGKAGDEPFELANKLFGKAFVIADANRVEAGLWAKEKFGITAFVLDDAFQHLKVQRDLDIMVIDATNPFGNCKTLPAGILREPLENLKRADLVVITRANLVENLEDTELKIEKYNKNAPIITAHNKFKRITNLRDFPETAATNDQQPTKNFLAFCGLGNPDNFFEQLRREKFEISTTKTFGDHYKYSQKDVNRLEKIAREENVEALLTTAKDAVKLKHLEFKFPCFVAESQMIFDDEKKLRKIIYAVFE